MNMQSLACGQQANHNHNRYYANPKYWLLLMEFAAEISTYHLFRYICYNYYTMSFLLHIKLSLAIFKQLSG